MLDSTFELYPPNNKHGRRSPSCCFIACVCWPPAMLSASHSRDLAGTFCCLLFVHSFIRLCVSLRRGIHGERRTWGCWPASPALYVRPFVGLLPKIHTIPRPEPTKATWQPLLRSAPFHAPHILAHITHFLRFRASRFVYPRRGACCHGLPQPSAARYWYSMVHSPSGVTPPSPLLQGKVGCSSVELPVFYKVSTCARLS